MGKVEVHGKELRSSCRKTQIDGESWLLHDPCKLEITYKGKQQITNYSSTYTFPWDLHFSNVSVLCDEPVFRAFQILKFFNFQ
jgi:hypothetical protein